ncbi:UbiA family prenyltransferase [Hymenobacter sp. 15J16-1T3B]|uniref:UbiA family prenyltransferase n=1 Tax=Hymenobacter sp. 15J16-1T3B TaxID=2886941 RepID=UPI001D121537|nr:UbiA family prenyltransferase [Hymenobacter sp. 15J16-1T3B]MCC3155772.1 UbiA family prenyltransferase [Hymenobacter sp. 15J16-1T3B]
MAEPAVSRPAASHLVRWAQGLLDALLYSNGLVAGSAAALAVSSAQYWRRPLPWTVSALVLAATLFVYNLNGARRHSLRLPPNVPPRRRWIVQHRPLLVGIVAASALALLGLYLLTPFTLLLTGFLGHLALLSLAYSWPVLPPKEPGGRRRGLRDWPGLKTFLIAYVWSAVTVWLPALCLDLPLSSGPVWLLFARRFCFILAIALVFDLRDYQRDRRNGPLTLPGLLGYQGGRWLALACTLASVALLLPGLSPAGQLVLLLPAVLTALVVWFANETRSDYYFALLADGVLLVQAIVLIVAAAV